MTRILTCIILTVTLIGVTSSSTIQFPGGPTIDCPDAELCDLLVNHNYNELLSRHNHYFQNKTGSWGRVYEVGVDQYTLLDTPAGLGYRIISAVGYAPPNTVIVSLPDPADGFVVYDSGTNSGEVNHMIEAIREYGLFPHDNGTLLGTLAVRAIIYSHNHLDHSGGTTRWLEYANLPRCPANNDGKDGVYFARNDCVEIIAHAKAYEAIINTATRAGQQLQSRSMYMVGAFTLGEKVNIGIGGPSFTGGSSSFEPPSKTLSEFLDFRVAGMNLRIEYVPSETNDEIIFFMPDSTNSKQFMQKQKQVQKDMGGTFIATERTPPQKMGSGALFTGEALQGPPALPNLYSIRGTAYRSPLTWYETVDRIRLFKPWCMVPSHGVPIMNKKNVKKFLQNFRDAVQFIHDQSLRRVRQGYIPDEIVTLVKKIPSELISSLDEIADGLPTSQETQTLDPRDHLRSMYGSVPQAARAIYAGYIGWFQGDPTFLQPIAPTPRANRYLELLGGACEVLAQARENYDNGMANRFAEDNVNWKEDIQFAAELATYIISATDVCAPQVRQARILKAKALLQLAYSHTSNIPVLESDNPSVNPNWANFLMNSAGEITLHTENEAYTYVATMTAPGCQLGIPPRYWVQHWGWRLNITNSDQLKGQRFGWKFVPDGMYWNKTTRYILEIGVQVARLIDDEIRLKRLWPKVDLAVSVTYDAFKNLLQADTGAVDSFSIALQTAVEDGSIQSVQGSAQQIGNFYKTMYFDAPPVKVPPIADRPVAQGELNPNVQCDCSVPFLGRNGHGTRKRRRNGYGNGGVAAETGRDPRQVGVPAGVIVGASLIVLLCVGACVGGAIWRKRGGYQRL